MQIVRLRNEFDECLFGALQPDGTVFRLEGNIYASPTMTDEVITGELLAPIVPTSIFCIGLNYKEHAKETNSEIPDHPVLFMKGLNSVANPGQPILLPRKLRSDKVDFECELAVVIGRAAKNVRRDFALEYVLGYTCANDVSARDWQKHAGGGQWVRAKSFDTFCPLGPAIVTADELPNPNSLAISTTINGEKMQDSNTADMIYKVGELIEFLSGSTTLLPGTVILTGTPHGVGLGRNPHVWLQPGDTVTVEIENIGTLTNPVEEEKVLP
ncbi:MAG: fumarylacetoacetate hydrolase family protein [Puniceicoccales bacterium]